MNYECYNSCIIIYEPAKDVFEEERSFAVVVVAFQVEKHQQCQQKATGNTSPDN